MKPYTKALLWSCVVLLATLAVLFVYSPLSARALSALNILPQPERYTELFFNLPLPQHAAQGAVTFSFTVGNHEGRLMQYDYIVYVQSASGARVLATGALNLEDGQREAVERSYPIGGLNAGQFFVQLPQLGEEIHFSLPRG